MSEKEHYTVRRAFWNVMGTLPKQGDLKLQYEELQGENKQFRSNIEKNKVRMKEIIKELEELQKK